MSFQLSPDVDKSKAFLVNLSNCKGRLDPYYYKPEFIALRERLEKHPLFQRMGSLIKSWNRGDGPREGFYTDDTENGVFFLRVNNLKNHTIDTNEIKYITRYVHENTLKRAKVTAGDVVFAISGTKDNLGTVSVIPENILEANLNSALVKLELDWSVIDKRYFCYMFDLNITITQIDFIGKGAAQNNLNNEEISQIQLFIPSIKQQQQIVNYLDEAHSKKEQKEAEAQRSLDSIDDYLLTELGIDLSKAEENTLQNRIFYRNLSNISGGRFDPELALYNQEVFSSNFETKQLKQLLSISPQYGANEPGIVRLNQDIPRYIRITDIDDMGNLIEELGVTANIIENQYILNTNDLLIARSGNTVGKSYLHKSENVNYKCFYAGYMIRFIINLGKALPDYIFCYLQSKPYKQWVKAVQRITGQPNINAEEYKSLLIPIPPLEKQLEIVDRITTIRNQAKQLRQEAEAELERAKQEVEAIILGERDNEA